MSQPLTYKKLKPSVKTKWLAALRSGKYRKTRGYLQVTKDAENRDGNTPTIFSSDFSLSTPTPGFCCLGVVCKELGMRYKPNVDTVLTDAQEARIFSSRVANGKLASPIITLMDMNDGDPGNSGWVTRPKSFKQIADWIEKNL